MLHEKVEERTAALQKRKENLLFCQLDSSDLSQCSYLFRRLRYPVLHRVMLKILILVEAYLLYQFFYLNFALSVIFIFYLLNFLRQLAAPITQRLRELLTIYRLENNTERAGEVLRAALFCIIALSLFGGIAVGVWAITSMKSSFLLALVLTHIVIFPLSMCVQTTWAAVYTQQRLRRQFLPVLSALLLPSVCLVTFSEILGPSAYIAGVFIGGLCEGIYLLSLAVTKLHEQRIAIFRRRNVFSSMKRLIFSWQFFYSSIALSGAPLYSLLIAIALFSYRPELWLGYFLITHLATLFIYPVSRISHAYGVDIFMSLKQLDFFHTKRLLGRCKRYITLFTLFISTFVAAGALTFSARIQFSLQEEYAYWILLILLLLAKSIYTQNMNLMRWMGSERSLLGGIMTLSFLFFIPFQIVCLISFRANLALILLNEIAFFFLLGILLTKFQSVKKSPYGDLSRSRNSFILRNPLELESVDKNYRKIGVVQIEKSFSTANDIQRLFERVRSHLKRDIHIISISRHTFFLLLPRGEDEGAELLVEELERSFASCLRGVYQMKDERLSLDDIPLIVEKFSQYRHCDRWIKTIFHSMESGTWKEVSSRLKNQEQMSLENLKELLLNDLPKETSCIWSEGAKLHSEGAVNLNMLKKMSRAPIRTSTKLPYLLSQKGDLITVKVLFMPLLTLAKEGFSSEEISKIAETVTIVEVSMNLLQENTLNEMA